MKLTNQLLKKIITSCIIISSVISGVILATNTPKSAQAGNPNTFTLGSAKQTIKGFGVSSVQMAYGNRGYNGLTQAQRSELDDPLLNDIKINTMRYWGKINDFATTYGSQYNNIKSKVSKHLYQAEVTDANMNTEPQVLAQGIKNLKDQNNIVITHISACNECGTQVSLSNWPLIVIKLRQALDAQGLQNVFVVATEGPNNDDFWMDRLQAIRNNPTAWASLGVISSHSYSMALRPEDEAFKTNSGKEWWIGESSNNGAESLGDINAAGESIARVLHDFNSGADNWIWFIGHAPADAQDDRTRLIRYQESPFRTEKLEKFYYFKQFRDIFQDGSRIYDTISNRENKMPWTYQNYADMQATGAKNTDGSWSLGVVNYSGQAQSAKFKINELSGQSGLNFDIFRSNGTDRGTKIGTTTMVNGEVVIPQDLQSKDFVTLKSTTQNPTNQSSTTTSQSSQAQSSSISNQNSSVVSNQVSSSISSVISSSTNNQSSATISSQTQTESSSTQSSIVSSQAYSTTNSNTLSSDNTNTNNPTITFWNNWWLPEYTINPNNSLNIDIRVWSNYESYGAVEFFDNGISIGLGNLLNGSGSTAYSYQLNNPSVGIHNITAKITTRTGATTTTTPASVIKINATPLSSSNISVISSNNSSQVSSATNSSQNSSIISSQNISSISACQIVVPISDPCSNGSSSAVSSTISNVVSSQKSSVVSTVSSKPNESSAINSSVISSTVNQSSQISSANQTSSQASSQNVSTVSSVANSNQNSSVVSSQNISSTNTSQNISSTSACQIVVPVSDPCPNDSSSQVSSQTQTSTVSSSQTSATSSNPASANVIRDTVIDFGDGKNVQVKNEAVQRSMII